MESILQGRSLSIDRAMIAAALTPARSGSPEPDRHRRAC
jgi:hypothetical protein